VGFVHGDEDGVAGCVGAASARWDGCGRDAFGR
jgi:hypothetical protein